MKKRMLFFFSLILLGCNNESIETSGPYFPQVKMIIQNNCISCHSVAGTGEPKGFPVLLETDQQIVDQAEAIKKTTNDPASPVNRRMPYGGELNETNKKIILKWFEAGGAIQD